MDKETLNKAIEIKKEIEYLEADIKLLPITTHKRILKKIIGKLKRNYNKLYVVETYTYNKEVIALNEEDINCLIELRVKRIKNLKEELGQLDYGTIMVDEAQFLSKEDVQYLAEVADNQNKNILAYGLKTDINGNLFEGAAAWLALADEIVEMSSLCQEKGCNNKAVAHARYIDGERDTSGESVAIEKGNVTYKAVCRKHWRER